MALPFWKHPDHRIPTLGLYRQLLKTCLSLPTTYTDQPGPRRQPIPRDYGKEVGPPGSSRRHPKIERSYLFALIRDHFRTNRHNTSPRITAGLLREAEETLEKLQRAHNGEKQICKELEDLVNGRAGRLQEVIHHVGRTKKKKKKKACVPKKRSRRFTHLLPPLPPFAYINMLTREPAF